MIKKTTTAFLFMALLTCFILLGGTTAKADDLPDCKVVKTCTCTVDGVVRTLTVYENTYIYMQIGNEEPKYIYNGALDAGLDKYGTVWIKDFDSALHWWNYELIGYPAIFKRRR